MGTTRESLEVRAELRDQFTNQLNRLRGRLTTFAQRAQSAFTRVTRSVFNFRSALLALGGALVIRSLSRMVKGVADAGDRLQKLSIITGQSVEFLSEMRFAATQSGQDLETFAKLLVRGTRSLGEFSAFATKDTSDALNLLGDDIIEAARRGETLETLLPRISDRLKEMTNENERAAVAQRLFGRSAAEMLPLLIQGSEGIDSFREEARRLGLTWTQLQADQAAGFIDALDKLNKAFTGLKETIVREILPGLTSFLNALTEFIVSHREDILNFFRTLLPDALRTTQSSLAEAELAFRRIQLLALTTRELFVSGIASGTVSLAAGAAGFTTDDLKRLQARIREVSGRIIDLEGQVDSVRRRAEAESERRRLEELDRQSREAMLRRLGLDPAGPSDRVGGVATGPGADLPVELTREFTAELEQTNEALLGLNEGFGQLARQGSTFAVLRNGVVSLGNALVSSLTNQIDGFIDSLSRGEARFKDFGREVLGVLRRILIQMLLVRAVGSIGSALFSGPTPSLTGAQLEAGAVQAGFAPPSEAFASAQHGAIIHGRRPQLVQVHPPEVIAPLHRAREFLGGSEPRVVNVFNIQAMDSRDVSRFFKEGLASNRDLIGDAVANRFQSSPALRGRFR